MVMIQTAKTSTEEMVKQLYDSSLLRSSDFVKLNKKLIEVNESFAKDVESLGWVDAATFAQAGAAILGAVSGVGSIGMLVHVTWTSTSLGAYLAGTGTWAGLSYGACAGLATGGGLFVVAAIAGVACGLATLTRKEGDEASGQICSALCDAMDGLKEAHSANADHKKMLSAMREKLGELEVMAKD